MPGPFPVGQYARKLQEEMRKRARVQLIGEVTGVRRSRKQAYFELRDSLGAVPCSIWLDDLERSKLPEEALRDGAELVIAGGPDYYPGGAQASPSFSFRATHVRLAGEGDLLARLQALRKQLRAEGLFELQKQLARPLLPKTIGVVTAESGAARRDLLAGLARRGWGGTVVWAFAPVQDRHAAPAIAAALQGLAARPEVEAIVVTRGGGSLADLWAFCDEALCRTVALLRVPVISAIGHERDSTLLDDVAAVACSTPTHAAEAAVPLDCLAARRELVRAGRGDAARGGGGDRGPRAPSRRPRPRPRPRAGARAHRPQPEDPRDPRRLRTGRRPARRLPAADRDGRARPGAAPGARAHRRGPRSREPSGGGARALRGARPAPPARGAGARRGALRAHDPERTLERGYALAESLEGEPVTSAGEVRAAAEIRLRFADGRVNVTGRPAAGPTRSERDFRR